MRRAVAFYVDVLGFDLGFVAEDQSFARVCRDKATIQFIRTENPDVLRATANNISIYLTVDGIDRLYETLKPGLPLAVISANHQVEVVTRAREVGATFLQKPLTEKALDEFAADAAKRLSGNP